MGWVEADKTYKGGKEVNKRCRPRYDVVGKTRVAGIKDQETNKVLTEVAKSTSRTVLQDFVVKSTDAKPAPSGTEQ